MIAAAYPKGKQMTHPMWLNHELKRMLARAKRLNK